MASQNKLTLIRSFPDGTRLGLVPRVLRNVHAVTFIDTKFTIYLDMAIMTFTLKQNNLLIIKVSFSFIT